MYNIPFRVLIKGDAKAGKSQLSNRLMGMRFSFEHDPTIAVDLHSFRIENKIIDLRDMTGDKQFKHFYDYFEKNAHLILYCIDASQKTLENNLSSYKTEIEEIRSKHPHSSLILVKTKVDEQQSDNIPLIQKFAQENNLPCIDTSAKENTGTDEIKTVIKRDINKNALAEKAEFESIICQLINNIEAGCNRKTSGKGSNKVIALKNKLAALSSSNTFDNDSEIQSVKAICKQPRHFWNFFTTPNSVNEFEELLELSARAKANS
ncbi:ADP-ribosylation factor-like protein [Legionella dresdenensis]|uniref:ADP-ribosylation factor-like protein n=1 Tax=Legionella dresdenensis TaxID=450200 RepID=A0ABV8CI38_9GAMM